MANIPKPTDWWVYMIETQSGKLYTGITTDLVRRLAEHQHIDSKSSSKAARFFRFEPANQLVYKEWHPHRSSASRREAAIKKLSRAQKLMLINTI